MGKHPMRVGLFLGVLFTSVLSAAGQRSPKPQGSGSLTGHVTDQAGRPVPQVFLSLLRQRQEPAATRLRPVDVRLHQITEGNGDFRFDDLAPGEYFVVAMPRAQPRLGTSRTGFGITYYPSATVASDAKPVVVGPAEPGVANITLSSVPLATVSGTVTSADGSAPESGVLLVAHGDGLFGLGSGQIPVRQGGRFEVSQMPPGTYFFQMREGAWPPPRSELSPKISGATVVVSGKDILDVKVLPIHQARVRGRVIVHSPTGGKPIDPSSISVSGYPKVTDGNPGPQRPGTVRSDMTFELLTWPAVGTVRVFVGGREVRPITVRLNGVDVTDKGIDFVAGATVTGVEVEFTLAPGDSRIPGR